MTSRNKRTLWAAAVGVLITGGAVVGIAAPASAGTSDCPSANVCIWKDPYYETDGAGGHYVKFSMYIPDYGLWDYVGTSYDANNSATSIYNHGVSETAYMYAGDHHSGLLFSIPKGNYNWWLPAGQNDNIESGYYASYN